MKSASQRKPPSAATSLLIYASSGVELRSQALQRARRRLKAMGYAVDMDTSVRLRHQRFAGSDEQRLQTLQRVAEAQPPIALACRGGYGMTRLLDVMPWKSIARSVDQGTRWVGFSDMTALQLGLLAHTGRSSWHGPMVADDFGRELGLNADEDDANAVTCECFSEAMSGELEAIGFRTDSGFDGLEAKGLLWGGNLSMVVSMLGTPHWPKIKGGILFLEDVGEHPYRIERLLLQLLQAGVLEQQKAVLLGQFNAWKPTVLDRGYDFKQMVKYMRAHTRVPLITGFPFGHVPLKLTVPVGLKAQLAVQGRDVFLAW